jgi:Icc protein
MLVAHISDFHVVAAPDLCYGQVDTRAALARTIERLESLSPRPDLVVATGDLVDEPTPEAYAVLRQLLDRLTIPLRLIPGNHDERSLLAAAFPEQASLAKDRVNYVVDHDAFRLVAFDAVVAGKEYADPTAESLAWLEATLEQGSQLPTMMIMHHPPIVTGLAFMDAIQPAWPTAFTALIRRHPQVRLIACGHVHRPLDGSLGHARVSTAGSTAHQFGLATELDTPPRISLEPPTLRLHLWCDGEPTSFLLPVDPDFRTAAFHGVDETSWPAISAALKAGATRPKGATARQER